MRILYILRSMALMAGTERVVSEKINWLADHGFTITLVTYEQGEHPVVFPLHANIHVVDIDTVFYKYSHLSPIRKFIKYRKQKRLFAKRLKNVVDDFSPNIIITTAYSMEVAKQIAQVSGNAKLIMESHETCFSIGKEYTHQSHSLVRLIAHIYDKSFYRNMKGFDLVVCLTEGDAKEWRKHISRTEVIPNPLSYFPTLKDKKGEEEMCRIISAGRLEPVKGYDMLVDAFSLIADKCPNWHVAIFGKGSREGELRKQIENKGLENRVLVLPPTSNIYEEYQKSDFYVLTSHHEGLGMVMLEAMSCEIPCVAYRCDYGPEEIIEHQRTGLLVKNGDVQSLANAMLWMIEHPSERIAMGKRAREAVKKYDKEQIMKKWERLFTSEI